MSDLVSLIVVYQEINTTERVLKRDNDLKQTVFKAINGVINNAVNLNYSL
jgi:hypothetical protein